ncbi:MAG: YitT family protein [Erysipelotrichaceae bacterium]|nr:YitT family protein [Erysipelotrichaceae bacterium]
MNHIKLQRQTIRDYLMLSIGTLLIALAVKEYLIPCKIVTGSVSGLALLIGEVLPLNESMIVLALNISCLGIGVRYLGNKFGVRCIYISVLLPLLMAVLPESESLLTSSKAVNVLIFLCLLTAGQSIMLHLETTSGGLDTIAEVLARKLHVPTGWMIGVLGALVSVLTAGVYGREAAVLGVLATLSNGLMINAVAMVKDLKIRPVKSRIKASA